MSWRYVLTINRLVLMKEQPAHQVSPMFEPPQTVESWDIKKTKGSPNFSYKNGTLQAL